MNKSGLTGALLSLMLFAVGGYPAIAQTDTTDDMGTPTETDVTDPGASIDTTTPDPDAQMEMDTESSDSMDSDSTQAEVMRGKISSIVGDAVTVELDSGEIETVEGLSQDEVQTLVPGMVVYVSNGELYMDEMAQQPVGGETDMTTESMMESSETTVDTTETTTTETTTTEPTYGTEVDTTTTETTTTEPTYGTEVDTTTTTEPTYGTEVNTTTTTEPTYGTEVNTTTTTEPTYDTQEVDNSEPVRALW